MSSLASRAQIFSEYTAMLLAKFSVSQAKISMLIALLFVCLSAWITGQLLWYFDGEQATVTKWVPKAESTQLTPSSTHRDLSELLDAALFGKLTAHVEVTPVAPVIQDAPKTRLNLILVGAVSSSTTDKSLAVIANRGSQSTYGVGEKIDGTQAKLKRVFIDRVIIDNAGRDETLMLEGIEFSKQNNQLNRTPNRASSKPVQNTLRPKLDEELMASIRSEIVNDPQKILQYIRLSQVKKDGNLIGYRVRPGKEKLLFDSVGLKNGDIATSLNGQDLTDPSAMGMIWQSMSQLTELSLTVERNGQPYDIYIAL
ncbi:type II secretion system protein GspC [Vibrio sp. MA40-2]|uniref:type II secretion system protein GspC n=1 Tax=Vibrio sp. MA40-2 TaxID=3391828 RepID=UPI0039A4BD77